MRTRRSPRNQDRLWRALGGPAPVPVAVDPVAAATRALALPCLSPRTRRMLACDLERLQRSPKVSREELFDRR